MAYLVFLFPPFRESTLAAVIVNKITEQFLAVLTLCNVFILVFVQGHSDEGGRGRTGQPPWLLGAKLGMGWQHVQLWSCVLNWIINGKLNLTDCLSCLFF